MTNKKNSTRFCTITVISLRMMTTITHNRPGKEKKKKTLRNLSRSADSPNVPSSILPDLFKKYLTYFHDNLMRKKYTQLPVEKHTDRTEIRRHAQALVIVAYSTGFFACSSSGGVITVKG